MRLIDADKLLDILDVMIVGHTSASDVYDVVDGMSTVDAEPVVRCKDCVVQRTCRFAQWLGMNGYCSYGERMDGGI